MEEAQFEIGQAVIYSTNGICFVDSVEMISFSGGMPKEPYYVLRQKRNKDNQFYVPLKNEALTSKMRDPMQKEDIEALLLGLSSENVEWLEDRRERNTYFKSILQDGVSSKLLSMIICIYERRRTLLKRDKKLPVLDSTMLKNAEKLVEEEFAWVLDIEKDEVPVYIRKRLHIPEEE